MDNSAIRKRIGDLLRKAPKAPKKKCGKFLQDAITDLINASGEFTAKKEDPIKFLQSGMPVWRNKLHEEIAPTDRRRKIDIVVYDGVLPVALIEVESDLNDLQEAGISTRNGHYDVFSIAKSASGDYFHSYKSLERMAAAGIYYDQFRRDGKYPDAKSAVIRLETINSDSAHDHNPSGLPMFLVSGSCRSTDYKILNARLKSLDAELFCLT